MVKTWLIRSRSFWLISVNFTKKRLNRFQFAKMRANWTEYAAGSAPFFNRFLRTQSAWPEHAWSTKRHLRQQMRFPGEDSAGCGVSPSQRIGPGIATSGSRPRPVRDGLTSSRGNSFRIRRWFQQCRSAQPEERMGQFGLSCRSRDTAFGRFKTKRSWRSGLK